MGGMGLLLCLVTAPMASAEPAERRLGRVDGEGCMRHEQPASGPSRLDDPIEIDSGGPLALSPSRNPNFPAAFVFESHSAAYLASADLSDDGVPSLPRPLREPS
jgi:hypothetical protein